MNKHQELNNDNWKRGPHDNGAESSDAGNNQSAEAGYGPESAGPQNPGSMGHKPAQRTEVTGESGLSGSLHTADQSAGSGSGSPDAVHGGLERAGNDGPSGSEHKPRNFRLSNVTDIGAGGAKTKFRDNIAAIELLIKLESESRQASDDEQAILARYVGWGGLSQAFDAEHPQWGNEYRQLLSLLPAEEYEAARASTLNAHYTSPEVIDGIYNGLIRLGVGDGSNLLEPAAGTGHFAGKLPFNATMTLNELDPLSARICRQLYPEFCTIRGGFENLRAPEGYFDAAVGNPPFGDYRLSDPQNPGISSFTIHNYFMAKSLNCVREGGITAMVVSRYFLDSKNSKHREYIADRAHFLGAIRLPSSAFHQNALTTVTTDIVFLQKARPGEETDRTWVDTGYVKCPKTGESIEINAWLASRPEQLIGQMELINGAYAPKPECIAEKGLDLSSEISQRLGVLPRNVFQPRTEALDERPLVPEIDFSELDADIRVDSFFVTPDDRIGIRKPDLLGKGDFDYYTPRSVTEDERIRSAIELRDILTTLIRLETATDADLTEMESVRQQLNQKYDNHVKKYDYLSSRSNKSVLKYDPLYPLLQSLEVEYDKGVTKTTAEKEGTVPRKASAQKAAIFSHRVNKPSTVATHADNAKDALVISLNETGSVDITRIATLTKKTQDDIIRELQGLIYLNPQNLEFETPDRFLSGDVKKKLEHATRFHALLQNNDNAEQLKTLLGNAARRLDDFSPEMLIRETAHAVSALQAKQPEDIDAIDISVQLYSSWLPENDIRAFVREHLGIAEKTCQASFIPAVGKWVTKFEGGNKDLLHNTWGTARLSANEILDKIFNNSPVQVKDITGFKDDGKPVYTVNQEETLAAQGKAEQILNEFSDWIWKDPERRDRLARLYNDRFNTHVPAVYDGSHLTLPQASGDIKLRGTQKNAIWRGIQEGGGLSDHVVGAGKTLTAIATMMEQRRMGLINKPMVVVPNHLLGQWKDEFYKLYPGANVLVAEQSDFETDNRRRLFAQIATGDFDAVIIGHSSFKFLSLAPEDELAFLDEQVTDLNASLELTRQALGRRDPSIKEMEKQKKRLEKKIKEKMEVGRKDDILTFDQLGVDALFIDEADEFKNLAIVTSLSNVAGLGNLQGSEKAMDLFLKCRWLQKKRDSKGVYFLTGTPISNSLAELYTMQRYLQYDTLKEKGIASFDSWSSTFGQVVTGWELDATGVNYRMNARFAKFTNVPELMRMYRSFADVVMQEDLAVQARNDGTGRLVPKIKGGKPTSVIVPRSRLQAQFMGEQEVVIDEETNRPMLDGLGREVRQWTPGSIIYRMENMPKDSRIDNALKVTHDARIAALDFRLVNPHAPDDEGSKVNEAVRRIHDIWEKNTYRKGTQLVFCDLSTPKRRFTRSEDSPEQPDSENAAGDFSMDDILADGINPDTFSVYEDIKQKLIDRGIPENEIRFIHDATNAQKRAELFRAMNNGDVRVLIGSTSKMGAGTNVQRRLVALHDLDCPWRPRDLEQRHGRIIRQGNMFFEQDKENFEVEICCYATERTYDARMWQTIEVKARGIEQFRNGSLTERVIEDIAGDAANAAEMKASATGNQLIFQQVKIDGEKRKQETLYRNWQRSRHDLEKRLQQLPVQMAELEGQIPAVRQDVAYILSQKNMGLDTGVMTFRWRKEHFDGGKAPDDAVEKLETYIKDQMRKVVDRLASGERAPVSADIGIYRGATITMQASVSQSGMFTQFTLRRADGHAFSKALNLPSVAYGARDTFSTTGFFTRLDNILAESEKTVAKIETRIEQLKSDQEIVKNALQGDYPQKAYLDALRQDAIDVMAELKKMQDDDEYQSDWKPASEEFAAQSRLKEKEAHGADDVPVTAPAPPQEEADEPAARARQQDDTPAQSADDLQMAAPASIPEDADEPAARARQQDDTPAQSAADMQMAAQATAPENTDEPAARARQQDEAPAQSADDLQIAAPATAPENTDEPAARTRQQKDAPAQSADDMQVTATASTPEDTDEPADEFLTIPFAHGVVVYNTGNDRLQVKFSDKPTQGSEAHRIMCILKEKGRFYFAPAQDKSWVRRLSDKAVVAAANILHVELPLPSEQQQNAQKTADEQKTAEIPEFLATPRTFSAEEIASMEIHANELFNRHSEGLCDDNQLFISLRQLAEAGNAEGKFLLSFCYFDGIGVQPDNETAISLLNDAAKLGHAEANHRVGELYETGEFQHPVDLKQAQSFYLKADPANPALERVSRKLKESRASDLNGFHQLLAEHKEPSEAETRERFFSRMNLLYEKIAQAQRANFTSALDKETVDKMPAVFCSTNGIVVTGQQSEPETLAQLNNEIMGAIREAVSQRQTTGLSQEITVGTYAGLTVNVRSVENELRFSLQGSNTWCPEELAYKKGVREKFRLPEFLDNLATFPEQLRKLNQESGRTLDKLREQQRAEEAKYQSALERQHTVQDMTEHFQNDRNNIQVTARRIRT